jgi:NAD(P)-dependent dehydrogenase (short-subunit alcohol dehydrogenase family)
MNTMDRWGSTAVLAGVAQDIGRAAARRLHGGDARLALSYADEKALAAAEQARGMDVDKPRNLAKSVTVE